ncbi:hypothetical protein BJ878DRAFT_410844 [Calycina marina]|uniref:Uncharacterized protein n=1 Tax=Calycina marina TaxID=1763456 RepID=A0A9P7ZBX7_9HELO|nr:hypothetical protein BJ878DRAFT_410844 [Calycina marina]
MATFYYGLDSPDFSTAPRHHSLLPVIFEPKDDDLSRSPSLLPAVSNDTMDEVRIPVPIHPIPSMQEPFAESMQEAGDTAPSTYKTKKSAAVRRQILLDQDTSEDTHATKWRQKPGQKFHELWKIMAQISFGIYLLLNGIAKDDTQVMRILQGHVDEIDEFLEMTLEDFDLAKDDIDERLKFLKVPLDNISIFDAMLEDRAFRLQIVSGNERIEHVIQRTAAAMKDALQDIREGLNACREFSAYLEEEQDRASWRYDRQDTEKVYEAMKGNVEGWHKAYVSLQKKGNSLGVALVQLGSIVAEMDRRAGEISRKTRFHSPRSSISSIPSSTPPRSNEMRKLMLKVLPSDPNMITPAISASLPAFGMVQDQIKQRSSLRKRFTLKRNSNSEPLQETPTDFIQHASYNSPQRRINSFSDAPEVRETALPDPHRQQPSVVRNPIELEAAMRSPASGGFDSAYCSDFDKQFSPATQQITSKSRGHPAFTPPILSRDFLVPSPHSDQQVFHPVQASPNSPLQRPWTAAPYHHNHIRENSGGSGGSMQSRMGMSMMSDMTMKTDANGKKVKKKRSAFGWLKKAFSLSEEEKAAFEERRRRTDYDDQYYQEPQQKWLDGKRIR